MYLYIVQSLFCFPGLSHLFTARRWFWTNYRNCTLVFHLWKWYNFWPTTFGMQLSSRFLTLWSSRIILQPCWIWQNWLRLLLTDSSRNGKKMIFLFKRHMQQKLSFFNSMLLDMQVPRNLKVIVIFVTL